MSDVKVEEIRSPRKLHDSELTFATAASAHWIARLPDGVTVAQAMQPMYWANVARRFDARYENFITLVNEQRTLVVPLYVRVVGNNELHVVELPGRWEAPSIALSEKSPLKPVWNASKRGFDIVRTADKAVIQDGSRFKTREDAIGWIENHLRALAA